ncbi:sugar transferase [uncultured Algibacter sp.]|uniref:sugar transferase n=1 Tax=uncultured Algibacter sp. TaxID=298659 RepID=UPI002602B077|nr:sugar transferase [uncultured Algibacter sp.]
MLSYLTIKRFLDITLSLVGILLLLPIFIIVFLCLIYINKGKPFFFQERPGKNERIFKIVKFKSMTDQKDEHGQLLPNAQRVTVFGNFIRKYSLDEIPQLFNILKGDMSLIGPRPLRVHYLPYYTKKESIRHSIRPGVTGLAQVSGRNLLSWNKKLALDIAYVENISFSNDFMILLKTAKKIFNTNNIELDPDMPDLDDERKHKLT